MSDQEYGPELPRYLRHLIDGSGKDVVDEPVSQQKMSETSSSALREFAQRVLQARASEPVVATFDRSILCEYQIVSDGIRDALRAAGVENIVASDIRIFAGVSGVDPVKVTVTKHNPPLSQVTPTVTKPMYAVVFRSKELDTSALEGSTERSHHYVDKDDRLERIHKGSSGYLERELRDDRQARRAGHGRGKKTEREESRSRGMRHRMVVEGKIKTLSISVDKTPSVKTTRRDRFAGRSSSSSEQHYLESWCGFCFRQHRGAPCSGFTAFDSKKDRLNK